MPQRKIKLILFSIGACGYGLLEVIWRGYTHWSMLGAGGICFVLFSTIGSKLKHSCLFVKAILGSTVVTSIEFVFGFVFNILLKKDVWDYSKMPFNIGGQICAAYSFLWMLLSIIAIPFATHINKRLQKRK